MHPEAWPILGGPRWRLLVLGLAALDLVALASAAAATAIIRSVLPDILKLDPIDPELHLVASALVLPVLLGLFAGQGLYNPTLILRGTREYALIAHAATYGLVAALVVSYFAGTGPMVSRSWMLLVWALSILSVGSGRFVARRVVRQLRRRGQLRSSVVIVGASAAGVAVAERLLASQDDGIDVVGFLDEYLPMDQALLEDIRVIGRPADLVRGAASRLADEYILIPNGLPHERLLELTRLSMARSDLVLRVAVGSAELLTHGLTVIDRADVPLITVHRARIVGVEALLKRALDLVGGAGMLVVMTPLALLAGIRAYVKGVHPMLRWQSVYGVGGERVTFAVFEPPVASWLALRGAPALAAVLRGKLSLVGPRPASWASGEPMPAELWTTAVKPGLTGPWRLSGPDAPLEDQAVRDLAYVRSYTIWEDLRILGETGRRLSSRRTRAPLARWQDSEAADRTRSTFEQLGAAAAGG